MPLGAATCFSQITLGGLVLVFGQHLFPSVRWLCWFGFRTWGIQLVSLQHQSGGPNRFT